MMTRNPFFRAGVPFSNTKRRGQASSVWSLRVCWLRPLCCLASLASADSDGTTTQCWLLSERRDEGVTDLHCRRNLKQVCENLIRGWLLAAKTLPGGLHA